MTIASIPFAIPFDTGELLDLCAQAAAAIMAEYASDRADEYHSKSDDSPLTRADIASHRILVDGLSRLTPDVPVLSEESPPAAIVGRRDWTRLWIVDPLDGTKEFLGRTGEFTINLALVEGHRAVLGILYVPLEDRAYLGIPGEGAWCYARSQGAWEPEVLQVRQWQAEDPLLVLASRRHRNDRLKRALAFLENRAGPLERQNSGSALKFVQLARGNGDVYPRFSPCSEWDVAAGQALLEGAGGQVLGLDGRPLTYNARDSLLSPYFVAVADPSAPLWRDLLQTL